MAAEKFIRVSVTLPVGVRLATASKSASGSLLGPFMRGECADFFGTELSTSKASTGPLTLTLECPEAKRDELCNALSVLIRDLVG